MKKIGICIGHSRSGDQGATSVEGESEWIYNSGVAPKLAAELRKRGFDCHVYDKYEGNGYGAAMSWIAGELRDWGADIAVELHFNAAGATAHGYEYLYWNTSTNGKKLAQAFLDNHRQHFPAARSRGIKSKQSGDRGSGFLSKTHCPAIITEPFFGTNAEEWAAYSNEEDRLAIAHADAITSYFQ